MTEFLADTEATEAIGARLLKQLPEKCVIFLHGDLGAGKTTLVRGFLRALGYTGAVKSPTYTLVEQYDVSGKQVCHFDLYRLNSPEEMDYLGFADYLEQADVCWIEWPEKAYGYLSLPTIEIFLDYQATGRMIKILGLANKEI